MQDVQLKSVCTRVAFGAHCCAPGYAEHSSHMRCGVRWRGRGAHLPLFDGDSTTQDDEIERSLFIRIADHLSRREEMVQA